MLEIGESLREARSRRGLDLEQVEAGTMIRARYLVALEQERFDLLPPGAYRRSFLREYASFLGLDGDILVDEYRLRCEPLEPEPPPSPPPMRMPAWLEELPLGRSLAVLGAVAAFGIAVWLLGGTAGRSPAPPAARAAAPRRPQAPPARTVPRPTPHKAPSVLVLTAARGACWLLVRIDSSAGQSVYERTLQQGQTVRFGLRKPLWIRLGAPWNLEATIGKRVVDHSLPTLTGDALATPSGLSPAS